MVEERNVEVEITHGGRRGASIGNLASRQRTAGRIDDDRPAIMTTVHLTPFV
jgi:hypothetical protein